MANNYNIPQTSEPVETTKLIIKAFGLEALKSTIYVPAIQIAQNKAKNIDKDFNPYKDNLPPVIEKDAYNHSNFSYLPSYPSKLDTPVMSDLDIDTTSLGIPNLPRLNIPTVLFTVSQKKNIISTAVQGRNGTVKEYISDGDFNVNVKGVLVGDNGKYPRLGFESTSKGGVVSVDYLMQVLKANKAITVNSWYLKIIFGISELVITDYNFPQNEGEYSVQPFEFNAISDTEYIFNLTK